MTDDTRDRDRPFADAREPPETAGDGQAERTPPFDRTDRTRGGTAETTRSAAGQTTRNRTAVTDPSDGSHTDPNADSHTDPSDGSCAEPNTEPNGDRVEERLRAVERALTGTDDAVADIGDEAAASAEREELSTRLDDLEARVEELEAATQAVRGYVGSIRSVNQAVERRADLALAKASESRDAAADDDPIARGGATATDNGTVDDALDAGVPSEADLDAAVPTNRRRGNGQISAGEPAADRAEADGEEADDSWRAGALDRLRDSL